MIEFFKKLFFTFLLLVVFLEILIRLFGLATPVIPGEIIKGNYRLKPNQHGKWVKGPLKEINSFYSINSLGFNSVINYDLDSTKIKIALIGDSFIEGLHSNVNNSIGRRLELLVNKRISVHEYGISGWNAHNYIEIARKIKRNYKFIFVLISDTDLIHHSKNNPKINQRTIRHFVFDNCHLLRYILINRNFMRFIHEDPSLKNAKNVVIKPNYSLLNSFPENVIFVFENSNFHGVSNQHEYLRIAHNLTPFNFGSIDTHWNDNGRENCAKTISLFLDSNLN